MPSFTTLAKVTASTKRPPATSGNKRGTPVANVLSLTCTPLDPAQADLIPQRLLETPLELLQTFVDNNVDIVEGDLLVVGSTEYPIRYVGDWAWRNTTYRYLLLEKLKRA
jgi:hypothetical protein